MEEKRETHRGITIQEKANLGEICSFWAGKKRKSGGQGVDVRIENCHVLLVGSKRAERVQH